MLAVVGDLLEDVVVHIGGDPARGTDTPARIERRRGGSAANVAAAVAAAGAPVRFIGRVGTDPLGEWLVEDLAAAGVDVRVQRRGRTGSVVVLVGADGERTMLPDRGAAAELDDVDTSWSDGVSGLHVPSYSLLTEPIATASTAVIDRVRSDGGRITIDASSAGSLAAYGAERYGELLRRLEPDVVFANRDEAPFVPAGPWTAVIKSGPDPVEIVRGSVHELVPVPDIGPVADTTGAGDAFAAGYLVAAMAGADVRRAAEAGVDRAAMHLLGRQRLSGGAPP